MPILEFVRLEDKAEEVTTITSDLQIFAAMQLEDNGIKPTEMTNLLLNTYVQTFNDHALVIKKRHGQDAVNTLIEDHMQQIRKFIRHVSDTCR